MSSGYFAEGVTIIDGKDVYQLTYKSGDILTWQLDTTIEPLSLELVRTLKIAESLGLKAGWGLTSATDANGKSLLYATDGSSTITEIDP